MTRPFQTVLYRTSELDDTLPTLRLRWRYVLSFATGGMGLLGLGVLAEVFVAYTPGWILGASVLLAGAFCTGYSVYLSSTIRQGEGRLRQAGLPWKVDRSILGTARRTLTFGQPEYICVGQAYKALQEPSLGLAEVEFVRHGAEGVRPAASTGPLGMFLTRLPLGVTVRARGARTGTELRISVRLVTLWWFRPIFQVDYSWVKDAEILIDQVAAVISKRFE